MRRNSKKKSPGLISKKELHSVLNKYFVQSQAPEEFDNGGLTLKMYKCFPSTLRWGNLKTQQSPAILNLCLKKTGSGKSRDYRDVNVF